jgi:hypothetical protein
MKLPLKPSRDPSNRTDIYIPSSVYLQQQEPHRHPSIYNNKSRTVIRLFIATRAAATRAAAAGTATTGAMAADHNHLVAAIIWRRKTPLLFFFFLAGLFLR